MTEVEYTIKLEGTITLPINFAESSIVVSNHFNVCDPLFFFDSFYMSKSQRIKMEMKKGRKEKEKFKKEKKKGKILFKFYSSSLAT